VNLIPVTLPLWEQAARLRGLGLKTPNALHAATVLSQQCVLLSRMTQYSTVYPTSQLWCLQMCCAHLLRHLQRYDLLPGAFWSSQLWLPCNDRTVQRWRHTKNIRLLLSAIPALCCLPRIAGRWLALCSRWIKLTGWRISTSL